MSATVAAAGAGHLCADCGTPAPGRFCPACGQKTVLAHTLGSMVSGLVHDLTHIDGTLWRTLPLLALKPGLLTRRYIDGWRTRYVGPSVVFLSSAFFMFLAFNLLPGPPAQTMCDPAAQSAVHRAGAAVREDLEQMGPRVEGLLPPSPAHGPTVAVQWIERHAPAPLLGRLEAAFRNPEMALSKVKQKAYKLGFLLVPLSLPALWLLLGRRPGVRAYDLAVFSLYSIGFMSFLLTAVLLLAGFGLFAWPLYAALLLLVPPAHFYVHLRDCFSLTPGETLWRTGALCITAVLSRGFFLLLVLAWGVLG